MLRFLKAISTLLTKVVAITSTRRMALHDLQLRLLISELHYMQQLYLARVLIRSQYGCRKD